MEGETCLEERNKKEGKKERKEGILEILYRMTGKSRVYVIR